MKFRYIWSNICGSWTQVPDLTDPPREPKLTPPNLDDYRDIYMTSEEVGEAMREAWDNFSRMLVEAWETYRKDLEEYRFYYMQSKEWFELRRKVFQNYNNKCFKCGRKAEQAHHTNYKYIGGSREIDDVVAVCEKCHRKIHDIEEIPRKGGPDERV